MKVVAVLCVTACVTAVSALAAPPAAGDLRDCLTRGDSNRPQQLPTPAGVTIGPLVIWPSVRLKLEPTGPEPWAYYVKAPIVLPARTKVTLAVARRAEGLVELQGRRNVWVTSVRFEACRESVQSLAGDWPVGKYTGFPFGFRLSRPSACIPMEVWVEGQAAPIRRLVPFGRRSCGTQGAS